MHSLNKINITWKDGIVDTTGYLFSLAKAIGTAVKNSPYKEYAEDIVATSGLAFCMWVAQEELSPSAISSWNLESQKTWVENGGLYCDYVGRFWDQDNLEETKRTEAITMIKKSIDIKIPAIVWDVGGAEWGLILGYDEDKQIFLSLSITGVEVNIPYNALGKCDIPILSVLTITGKSQMSKSEILNRTLKQAVFQLKGEDGCDIKKGLEAYPVLIEFFNNSYCTELSWNMEYYLGTYGGLKYYAYQYFNKLEEKELSELYEVIYERWYDAFITMRQENSNNETTKEKIIEALRDAYEKEEKALAIMEKMI